MNPKEGEERAERAGGGGNEKARQVETGRPGNRQSRGGHEKSNLDGCVSEYWEVGGREGYNNLIPQSVLVER